MQLPTDTHLETQLCREYGGLEGAESLGVGPCRDRIHLLCTKVLTEEKSSVQ